ncbi:MAG: DUF4417 domain-containing protein [Bacilli bacterium]
MIETSNKAVKDLYGAHLLEGAEWVGAEEYPKIEEWMVPKILPQKVIPFDKIKEVGDLSNYFVCFYCSDESFLKILRNPKKYLNMLRKPLEIIGFDFSVYTDMPLLKQKSQIFNNLSLSYFMGKNGIPIIPNIRYGVDRTRMDFLKAIPSNSLIAFGTYGFIKTIEEQKVWFDTIHKVIDTIHPSGVIVYGTLPKDIVSWFKLNRVPLYIYESHFSVRMKEVNVHAN